MSAVWGTIRDALKAAVYTDFNAMPFERESAMLDAMAADLEAKLPLLTSAHAAVVEAAEAERDALRTVYKAAEVFVNMPRLVTESALRDAVTTFRALAVQP